MSQPAGDERADGAVDADPADELRALVAAFRTQLAWRRRGGGFAAPAAPTPRAHAASAAAQEQEIDAAPAAAPPTPSEPSRDDGERRAPRLSLAAVREELGDCTRCKLSQTRQNIVFGVGDPEAALMFIGEGPGAEEDRRGEPFVGKAGQLLDKMIRAMGWTRDSVYIANIVKCRPPGNRDPEPDEVEACEPFLARQIEAVRPRVIVTLGRPSTQLLLRTRAPISALRGKFQEYRGIRVMPTFHPAFLLRSPERKREAWDDLRAVMAELDRLGVAAPGPTR
jgi:DNA polymerase